MTDIDLSFRRYVAKRKSIETARTKEGDAYAFAGDLKVRRTLGKLRPVTIAVEATVRLWRGVSKSELLGTGVKVGDKQFAHLHKLAIDCAQRLRIPVPTLWVSPKLQGNAQTLGTSDEALIVISTNAADHFSEEELRFLIARECGHLQNDHVLYATALYHLTHAAQLFVRWLVKPAVVALRAWARRAEVTCDRAGLIVMRDLPLCERALVRLAVGSSRVAATLDVEEYLKQIDEQRASVGRLTELLAEEPYLPKRIAALRLFADSSYYQTLLGNPGGTTQAACDEAVGELMGILR